MTETRGKYNARPETIDGIRFASQAEARRYHELRLLVMAGEIGELVCHPAWILFPADKGRGLKAIRYTADFQYNENGRQVVEDVKGVTTRDAALRMNIFQRQHPEIEFRIIHT